MSLKGTTALITGGAQGLGKGFAKVVLQLGGKVALVDILASVGLDTQNEFNKEFGSGAAIFIKCDVRKREQLEEAFYKTQAIFGAIDLVVNNAGVSTAGNDWERTIDINLTAVMRGCLLAAEYMHNKKGGRKVGGHIINIASTAGLTAVPFDPAYAASKHGVVGLSRSLALVLKPQSIRVNCLCPSFTDTNMVQSSLAPDEDNDKEREKFRSFVQLVGLNKISDVTDAFTELIAGEGQTGSVMQVTPQGHSYKYPGQSVSKL